MRGGVVSGDHVGEKIKPQTTSNSMYLACFTKMIVATAVTQQMS